MPDLLSYIGYFALVWFTWLQVALFDVRFGIDSVFERLCKALHFGVMTGFAIIATDFLPDQDGDPTYIPSFRSLSLILMASRLILAFQYLVVGLYVRHNKQTWLPLLLTIGSLFVSAMVYLGTYFSFRIDEETHTDVAWYVMGAFEAFALLSVSSIWKHLSFRNTPLVERLGLLTLIILGEGVIGMAKAIGSIVIGFGWDSKTICQVISAILILVSQQMPPLMLENTFSCTSPYSLS